MKELLYYLITNHGGFLVTIIIGFFLFIAFIILMILGNKGLLKTFNVGKGGLSGEFATSKKEIEKRFESGNIHKLMNDTIHALDHDLLEWFMHRGNAVRRVLSKRLNTKIQCVSTRRALASCLRWPLYESILHNNFKMVLRPQNIKFYVGRLMKEITEEYEEFANEIENGICPVDSQKDCIPLPPLVEVFEIIRKDLTEGWALPLRQEQIKMHYKKIDVYKQYAPVFDQLGDYVMKKICEQCIEKNQTYINALERKPEMDEL